MILQAKSITLKPNVTTRYQTGSDQRAFSLYKKPSRRGSILNASRGRLHHDRELDIFQVAGKSEAVVLLDERTELLGDGSGIVGVDAPRLTLHPVVPTIVGNVISRDAVLDGIAAIAKSNRPAGATREKQHNLSRLSWLRGM